MPLKSQYVKTYRKFININHKLVNSQNIFDLRIVSSKERLRGF